MNARPPLVGAELWTQVVEAAGGRCECQGECGQPHRERTCRRDTPATVRDRRCRHSLQFHQLHAVPRDQVPLVQAVALPPEALKALCVDCHARLDRRWGTNSQPSGQVDALF